MLSDPSSGATEEQICATYRLEKEAWRSIRATLEVGIDFNRKGRVWTATTAGLTKVCMALAARQGNPDQPAVSTPQTGPKSRGYAIPEHASQSRPAIGCVCDMRIVRCWPNLKNDRVVFCLLPGTDPGATDNFVPVRLLGPAGNIQNFRVGMILRCRLDGDGCWISCRYSPRTPGRWSDEPYAN